MRLTDTLLCPARERGWQIEATVRGVAGTLILLSVALSMLDRRWLFLTAFVGLNLFQSSLTGWCLMSNLLALFGLGGNKREA